MILKIDDDKAGPSTVRSQATGIVRAGTVVKMAVAVNTKKNQEEAEGRRTEDEVLGGGSSDSGGSTTKKVVVLFSPHPTTDEEAPSSRIPEPPSRRGVQYRVPDVSLTIV